jgi:hypothetical protein
MSDIPTGFVIRECGCMWYHYGENRGYLLEDCTKPGSVYVGKKPRELPTDQPYQVAHGLAVARIFEMLHEMCKKAEIGRKFLILHDSARNYSYPEN